jgi:hypothetical protein
MEGSKRGDLSSVSQAGSEFNPQQSQNNANLGGIREKKQRFEVILGVHGIH